MTSSRANSMQNLKDGQEKRLKGVEVRREVEDGLLSVADALDDPRAQSLQVHHLLSSQPGWGKVRTDRLIDRLKTPERRHVRDLTARQRHLIREATREPG